MTIYLPDDLAGDVTGHDNLNVSAVCQAALRAELDKRGQRHDVTQASLADIRVALDRLEAAIASPRVTPDDIGIEIAAAWQALTDAAERHTSGGPVTAPALHRVHTHVSVALRLLNAQRDADGADQRADAHQVDENTPARKPTDA